MFRTRRGMWSSLGTVTEKGSEATAPQVGDSPAPGWQGSEVREAHGPGHAPQIYGTGWRVKIET